MGCFWKGSLKKKKEILLDKNLLYKRRLYTKVNDFSKKEKETSPVNPSIPMISALGK